MVNNETLRLYLDPSLYQEDGKAIRILSLNTLPVQLRHWINGMMKIADLISHIDNNQRILICLKRDKLYRDVDFLLIFFSPVYN